VLERLHIPVDYVAGTSMGAVIGGLYASGLPVERIEDELRRLDWDDVLSDRNAYRDLAWRRKEDVGRYLLDLELGLRGGKLRVPAGLRAGQKLGFELQAIFLPVADVHDFSRLPIPFRACATDVETGERVVLSHGDLAQSLLASMTVPAVFAPVEIDGRLLVDGGMSDNLPVEVVRAMGADIVIAVDVGTPLSSREGIDSFLGVTNQAFTFLTRLNSERSAALADLVIRPALEGVSSGQFDAIPETIGLGEAAAEAQRASLEPLSAGEADWNARLAARVLPPAEVGPFSVFEVTGNKRVDERRILGHAGLEPGQKVGVPELRGAMRRVFGLEDFQSVRFDINRENQPTLLFRVREKPWGPTYLHFGIDAMDDLEGGAIYGVKANLTRTNLNALGAEWRNDLELGSHPSFRTELFQPLDFRGRFFVAPWLAISRQRSPIYEDGRRVADYRVDARLLELDVGSEYGRFGELRTGVYRGHVTADVVTGSADLPRFDIDVGGFAIEATFETLDRPAIPHTGTALRARAELSRSGLGAADSYNRLEIGTLKFAGRKRHTVFGGLDAGLNLGSTIPAYAEFAVGGLFSLGGYSEGELRGQLYGAARLGYHYRLAKLPSALGEGVYVGGLFETGDTWASRDAVTLHGLKRSGTLILGADTIIGPIFLAYGRAWSGSDRFYITVGRTL
jgi:NTE family protein